VVIARRASPGALRAAGALLLALGGPTLLGACEVILKATSGDRHVDATVVCSSGTCECRAGLGDCDGDVDNGCETDLGQSPNCGACGVVCKNSACVDAACLCQTGFADCDGDKANGCEAPTASDPKNCGSCHHDCGAGACIAGICQVSTVGTVPGISALEVAFGFVYAGVCNQPGPAVVSFTPGHAGSSPAVAETGCARAVAAAGTQIAWASDAAILLASIAGGDPSSTLASTKGGSRLLAGGPSSVYWWDAPAAPAPHALLRVSLGGGAPETIVQGDVTALTADFSQAYWSDQDGVHAVPHSGSSPVLLDGTLQARALAADPTTLYAADATSLLAIPLGGGSAKQLATVKQVEAIAADGFNVYWADQGDGTVREVPIDGGTVTVLASGQSFAPGLPIFADGRAVYWVSGNDIRSVGR
jgi:hypothetical protein